MFSFLSVSLENFRQNAVVRLQQTKRADRWMQSTRFYRIFPWGSTWQFFKPY